MIPEPLPIEPDRLAEALANLSPEQEASLFERGRAQGLTGGIKAIIAGLAQMSSQSHLSDILAGRTSGTVCRPGLEKLLNLPPGWLAGHGTVVPDWKLPPIEAWLLWRERIENAWHRRLGRPLPNEEDSGISRVAGTDEELAARLLNLPQGSQLALFLANRDWNRMEWSEVVQIFRALRLPIPSHPGHLAAGFQLAKDLESRVDRAVAKTKLAYERFLPPVQLFQLQRLALIGLKSQRQWQGKTSRHVDDALELLWRQQLLRAGKSKREVPPGFVRETGRTSWTPLRELQKHYQELNDDFNADYESEPDPGR